MEEEKTIERCEQLIKPEHANWIGISNQKAIRELLNILKEKNEEIEFQKDINKIEKDRHKKTEKSLKGQIIKNNKIIEKLEKEAQGYFETTIIQSEQFSKELKEKDKEIEKLEQALARNIARNVTSSMKESAKSKEDLEMLNAGWQIELEKKDKMIDYIIDWIRERSIYVVESHEKLKQYFKSKAEKE